MTPNILDRAIQSVAPRIAAKRLEARARIDLANALRPDGLQPSASTIDDRNLKLPSSTGAGGIIRRVWGAAGRDARSDATQALTYDRANSRDLARTNPIAVGAINTNVDRVVGTGLALSAHPALKVLGWTDERRAEWKALVQNEFSLWADGTDCDITGTHTFYQLQALVLRSVLESGDVFSLLPDVARTTMQPYGLRIQLIEADRVGNPQNEMNSPTVAGGIRIDAATGRPTQVHVYKTHPGAATVAAAATLFAGDWIDMVGSSGRRRILHHFRKLRPDQPRGLPYLAPIIESIKQLGRYSEAEIMAAVITAYLTVFIETPAGSGSPIFTGGADVDPGGEVGLGMGAVVPLLPGEKPSIVNPLRPNPNYEAFTDAVIKQMGMALGLPFELLVKQFNASYSASKAALLDAWVYFRGVRTWLSISFCQPVYETWLAEAVAIGRVSAPGFFTDPLMRWAYTRAAWPGDSMGSIDPKKEIEAYVAAIEARLMTVERAQWELFGTDFNDTFEAMVNEQKRLAAAGIAPVPKAGAAAPAAKPAAPANPEDPNADPENDDEQGTKQ